MAARARSCRPQRRNAGNPAQAAPSLILMHFATCLAAHELGVRVGWRRRGCNAVEVGEDRAEGARHALRLVHGARSAAIPAVAHANAILSDDAWIARVTRQTVGTLGIPAFHACRRSSLPHKQRSSHEAQLGGRSGAEPKLAHCWLAGHPQTPGLQVKSLGPFAVGGPAHIGQKH